MDQHNMLVAMSTLPEGPAPPSDAILDRDTAELDQVVRATVAAILGERREHPDVEDCTHETLRRALEGRERLRDGHPLRPWVLGIARHVALDALRHRRRTRHDAPKPITNDSDVGVSWVERLVDPGPAPDDRAASRERAQRLARLMEGMSEGQRRALLHFHVDGLAYQEIAERLGVPLGTVATWIARGRKSIAEALGE